MDHVAKCNALTALAVVGFLKTEVARYAAPQDQQAATLEVLAAVHKAVSTTPDVTVLSALTYPTPKGEK